MRFHRAGEESVEVAVDKFVQHVLFGIAWLVASAAASRTAEVMRGVACRRRDTTAVIAARVPAGLALGIGCSSEPATAAAGGFEAGRRAEVRASEFRTLRERSLRQRRDVSIVRDGFRITSARRWPAHSPKT